MHNVKEMARQLDLIQDCIENLLAGESEVCHPAHTADWVAVLDHVVDLAQIVKDQVGRKFLENVSCGDLQSLAEDLCNLSTK